MRETAFMAMARGLAWWGRPGGADALPLSPGPEPRRFVVQCISGIGNAVMATPLAAALKTHWPQSRVDFVTTPGAAALLEGAPNLDHVWVHPLHGARNPAAFLRAMGQLSEPRADAVFFALVSAGLSYLLPGAGARIPRRSRHSLGSADCQPQDVLATHGLPWRQEDHDVEQNLDLLRAIMADPERVEAGPLRLAVKDEHREEAAQCFARAGLDPDGRLIALCPGCGHGMTWKRWPRESFADLVERLRESHPDAGIALFCGPDEGDLADWFRENVKRNAAAVIQGLPLPAYPAALDRCAVVVSADSLPIHIRAALGKPLVALFGPTDPARTGPWMCPATVLTPDVDYAPFYKVPPPPELLAYPDCMALIEVDAVHQAVCRRLA